MNDEITGDPLSNGWSLHHVDLDESHYMNITNESNFMCLNRQTHEFLHWFLKHYERDPKILNRLRKICEKHDRVNKKPSD